MTQQDATAPTKGPLVLQMERKLTEAFAPTSLEVINESHLHAGHQPGFNGQGESHLRIRIVADAFNGQNRVATHRAINALMKEEFDAGLHALAIDAKGTA
ncbi:BolA family protein [Pseudahrensia aquimaris]|uniref:BolA family protein n=1 Tax=Pseudahrensia aquimaris TaxID=744461 RepID=A0ABW3FE62_9HYPH